MTFSIVAYDPASSSGGVAVATAYLAVGAMVPAAELEAGALATQAWTNMSFKASGLSMLREGWSAREVVSALLARDDRPDRRQLGVVDQKGDAAAWTGADCEPYASDRSGRGYTIQGNLLAGPVVLDAMESEWMAGDHSAPLAERLLAVIAAGDAAGGDLRGRQSAALYAVSPDGRPRNQSDVEVDLRVDDAPQPIGELVRLLDLHRNLGST